MPNRNTSLASEFTLILIWFKIAALAPFSENRLIHFVLPIYTIVLIIITHCSYIIGMLSGLFMEKSSNIKRISGLMTLVYLTLSHALLLIESIFQRRNQCQLMYDLRNLDIMILKRLSTRIAYRRLRHQFFRGQGMIFMLVFCLSLSHMISYYIGLQNTDVNDSFYWILCFWPLTIIRLRCTQIIFYLEQLRYRQELLNNKLMEIHRADRIVANGTTLLDLVIHDTMYPSINLRQRMKCETMTSIKNVYTQIWHLYNLFSQCFGFSCLVICTQYCINFAIYGYGLYVEWGVPLSKKFGVYLFFLVPDLIMLAKLCYTSQQCTDSVCYSFRSTKNC